MIVTLNNNHTATAAAVSIPARPYIFLAEDDLDDQELLTDAIGHHNGTLQVHAVNNGKKAISFLEALTPEQVPALIVLDYNLPEMDGAAILQALDDLKQFAHIPKVVWSTSSAARYEDTCLKLGATAYFVKPASLDGISEVVGRMLALCQL